MSKLAALVSMRKDLAFEFERELRAVRDLVHGVHRMGGGEHMVDFSPHDGFVAGSKARAAFLQELQTALHPILLRYANNLCVEGLQLGLSAMLLEDALSGAPQRLAAREEVHAPQPAPVDTQSAAVQDWSKLAMSVRAHA